MKKMLCKVMAALMTLSVFLGAAPAAEAKAATAITDIPLTVVSDINDKAEPLAVGDTIAVGTTSYTKQYKFTLKQPAYVVTTFLSDVCRDGTWGNLDTVNYKISNNQAGNSIVTGTSALISPSANEESRQYLVLDAGTYYITAKMSSDDGKSFGSYQFSVMAQYSSSITANSSKGKAKTVSTDKKNTGIITANTRNSWYKFKVTQTTTVNITSYFQNMWSGNVGNIKVDYLAGTLWDGHNHILAVWNLPRAYGEGYTLKNVTLKPGTYYLSFYGGQTYKSDSKDGLDRTDAEKDGYLCNAGEVSFKITTVKTPTGLKAVNQSGRKAKITYKASQSAKGYEIQYSTDKNFKKGVKKTSTKKTSCTLSKLTKGKTYYVRVRAWRTDEEGNKLYSAWTTKSVKIKK